MTDHEKCAATIRDFLEAEGIDAIVTTEPLLFETPYESLNMACPHGVTFYTQPTSEQIAKWIEAGTP